MGRGPRAERDQQRRADQENNGNDQRCPDAGNECILPSHQRPEQGDADDAAGLPCRVENAGRDAGARLFDTAKEGGGQRRNQQSQAGADGEKLAPESPVTRAARDA